MIMKNLKNYKNRFYSLLESKMGDVKPLINEEVKDVLLEYLVAQGPYGDPYQYKKEGDKYFYAKKGEENWIQQTRPQGIDAIKTKIFGENSSLSTPTGAPTTQKPNKTQTQPTAKPQGKLSNNNKDDLVNIIKAATDNPNLQKWMLAQTKVEGAWRQGSLNYDNNNPANMLPDSYSRQIDPNLTKGDRSRYAIFSTPELGFRAYAAKILRWANGGMPAYAGSTTQIKDPNMNSAGKTYKPYVKGTPPTLAQFIYQWAPPSDNNDVEAYIRTMLRSFPGETPETPMKDILGI